MNVTKLTEQYIADHPCILDSMQKDLINFSKLSRQIAKDMQLNPKEDFDAILIACRRYREKLKKTRSIEDKIRKVLAASKLEVRTKIVAVVVEKDVFYDALIDLGKQIKKRKGEFHIIEGTSALTIITAQEFLPNIKNFCENKIIRVNENLAEIILISPPNIEATPGIVSTVTTRLFQNNINILEEMSSWTDTIFLIPETDIGKAVEVLRF